MPLTLKRRERTPEDFQIAPMIDMVFLLLVFFMCVSSLAQADRTQSVDLAKSAESKQSSANADRGTLTIDSQGRIFLGEKPSSIDEVKLVVQKSIHENPSLKIVIRADRQTHYRDIKQVLEACAEVGAHQVAFATVPD